MATKSLSPAKAVSPAVKRVVTYVKPRAVDIGKQSGPTVRPTSGIPTGAGLISGPVIVPRPPTVGEDFFGGLAYVFSDPFNQGTYQEAGTGQVTTGANFSAELQTAVEESVTRLGGQFEQFLITRGGWIVALVIVIALMIVAGQAFLRGR